MDERPLENSAAPLVPQSPALYTIFTGPNGLRAGWRLAIFAAIIGTPYVFLMWVGRMMMKGLPAPKPGPTPITAATEVSFICSAIEKAPRKRIWFLTRCQEKATSTLCQWKIERSD